MPIAGTIRPVSGPQSTPTPQAARDAYAAAHAAEAVAAPLAAPAPVEGVPRGRAASAPIPAGSAGAPAPGAEGAAGAGAAGEGGAKPDQKVDAWRIEAFARQQREATQALLAAKAEREALARDRAGLEQRTKVLTDRETRIDAVEQRLQSYRYNPHLALQDLAQYGVTFEALAQAVAQGTATPDQIAAAEAAAARRDVDEVRRRQEQGERDRAAQDEQRRKEEAAARQREARDRDERDRRSAAEAEAAAAAQWKGELARAAAANPAKYPIVASRFDRGAADLAFQWAEDFLAKQGRVPENDEVLDGVETMLQAEASEIQAAVAATRGQVAPAPRTRAPAALSNDMRPAPAFASASRRGPPDEAERRTRTLQTLDRIFGRAPAGT